MIPVIALIGRPNVGKSTFYNRVTRSQDALVSDFSGLTRDRQYGQAEFQGKPYIIVDTGGIGVEDKSIDYLMSQQSQIALDEANVIFFMVDARAGMTPIDQDVVKKIRKLNKPIYVVVNKCDGLDEESACAEFQTIGFTDIFPVSATHGRGVQKLLSQVLSMFSSEEENIHADANQNSSIKVSFIGRPNVGKSTLINRILGEERVVVYDMPGTTRDSIAIPFERDETQYTLIDTAGVRRRARIHEKIEKFSIIKTIQAIQESNVCIIVIDAQEGLTDQDLHLIGLTLEAGRAMVLCINKWDGLDDEKKSHIENAIHRKLQFLHFVKIRFISALHGSGVGLLYKDINQAYASAMQKFSTPMLTRLLGDFVMQHEPPMVKGRRVKLRYAHAGGSNPPIIVIHGNQVTALPESYRRYLTNAYAKQLNLIGTPLKIEFKGSDNPFKHKKNLLTERQKYRKKRLIKHIKKNKKS